MSTTRQKMADLLKEGRWHLHRNTGPHAIYHCACGRHKVTVPTSPSDHRALDNFTTELRKCPTTRNIFDEKRPQKKERTVTDTNAVRHADLPPEDTSDPDPDITGAGEYGLGVPADVPMKNTSQKWVFAGMTDLIQEVSRDRWPDKSFTTNHLLDNPRIMAFFQTRGVSDRQDMLKIVTRSMRNLFKRGLRQLSSKRDGASQYTWAGGKTIAETVDEPGTRPDPLRGDPQAVHEIVMEKRREPERIKADGHSDTSALSPGDNLEVVAMVGENFLVRDEIGQLYALRPVKLEVL